MDSYRLFERFRHQAEHNFLVCSSRASIGRAAYEREKEVAFLENERAAGEIPSLFCYFKIPDVRGLSVPDFCYMWGELVYS